MASEYVNPDTEEIVTLRVRTGKDEEFVYGSRGYTVSSKKGLKIDRYRAGFAVRQLALGWSPMTGEVVDAKVYIEEDAGTSRALPVTALKADEIAAMKDTDGLGDDTILVDGKPVKKRTIDFKNKYEKKDFVENNVN